ncbi:molybdate transporter 1 [Forsythia ovata]|uniref:Molybdate transporter 1 n=1 Tax=Forsythia ovata TaxID=205694 RepID=A0ABD1XD08_9LAMI
MNLIGCWFGATLCCHGAGRLAGQYKFVGRSGGCVALLDVAKLVLRLFAGIELAMCSRDMNFKKESVVMLICMLFHLLAQVQHLDFFVRLLCICFLGQEDWVIANHVPQLSAIICRSNVELELSQCWSVYLDDLFDEFL